MSPQKSLPKALTACIILLFFASGHVVVGQKFYLGATAGAGLPTLENFDFSDSDQRDGFGYHGGAVASVRIKRLAGQAELLFSHDEFEGEVLGVVTTFKYNRITLPVLFKFYVIGGAHLLLGPRVGFLISAESEDEDGFTVDIDNTTESTDVGLQTGLGYDLPFGLNLNLRYNIGLTDFPGPDQNLGGLQISLAYTFLETGGIKAGIPSVKKRRWKGNK